MNNMPLQYWFSGNFCIYTDISTVSAIKLFPVQRLFNSPSKEWPQGRDTIRTLSLYHV